MLDELLKNINENDIITGCKNVPTIWYNDELGKKQKEIVLLHLFSFKTHILNEIVYK